MSVKLKKKMTRLLWQEKKYSILMFVSNWTPTDTDCLFGGSDFNDSTVTFISIFIMPISMTHIVERIIFQNIHVA